MSLFICVATLLVSLVHARVPGDVFNLTTFTLQTPFPSGSTIVEVKYPALKSYNSSVFYLSSCPENPSGCMTFFTPENGAHTSGSSFPRSELRENINWVVPAASSTETHSVAATLKVLDAGSLGKTCIGQVHTDGQGHCSIIVELEWDNGQVIAHLRDQGCSNKDAIVGKAALGDSFSYNITMVGDQVKVTTDTGSMPFYSYSWFAGKSTPQLYLKAGNYLQSSGSSATTGGLVQFSSLATHHSA